MWLLWLGIRDRWRRARVGRTWSCGTGWNSRTCVGIRHSHRIGSFAYMVNSYPSIHCTLYEHASLPVQASNPLIPWWRQE